MRSSNSARRRCTVDWLTPNAFAAACMLPARAKAKKYFRSSHSNILALCNFASRTRNLATAQVRLRGVGLSYSRSTPAPSVNRSVKLSARARTRSAMFWQAGGDRHAQRVFTFEDHSHHCRRWHRHYLSLYLARIGSDCSGFRHSAASCTENALGRTRSAGNLDQRI